MQPAAISMERDLKRAETIALLECFLAITLWGVSFLFMKIALRELSAATVIVFRYALGTLLVGFVSWQRGEFARISLADVKVLALLGAVGISLQQMLQVSGQVTADVGVAAFLAATAPAFTVVLAAVWLHERLGRMQAVGVLLASMGGIVVAVGGDFSSLLAGETLHTLPGNILILLSSVVWAVFIILSKRAVRNRPSAFVTSGTFFFGMLFSLPLFVYGRGWEEFPRLSPGGWSAILHLGVLMTAVAYMLNSHALKHISATRVAVVQNTEPLIAMIAAAVFMGEPVTGTILAGGAAILGGVYLAERNGGSGAAPREERQKQGVAG